MSFDLLTDEEGRLAALHRYGLLEGGSDPALERMVRIVQSSLDVPIAAISVVERNRVSFRAIKGMPADPLPRDTALCAQAITAPRPLIIDDIAADDRFAHMIGSPGVGPLRAYLGVPLVSPDGYNLGTICAADTVARKFSDRDVSILANMGRLAMDQLELHQINKRDYLTSAISRRAFQAEVEREYSRATRYDRPAALIFLDIDRFHKVNDAFGQAAGDEALKAVANRCIEATRQSDVFGRVGGEEFAFLLPEAIAHEAIMCAERMREIVSKLRFKTEKGVVSLTASFGVAALTPSIRSAAQWFTEADIALYAAKKAGRDCVMLAAPDKRGGDFAPDGADDDELPAKYH